MSEEVVEAPIPTQDAELEALTKMPVFGGVSYDALAFLLARAERTEVPAGDTYFREGDPGSEMFVLRRGQVELSRAKGAVREVLGHLGQGDCFGEMALLDLYPRSATVTAMEYSEAIAISPALLYELYDHSPEPFTIMMMNLARELSRRLRQADARLASVPEEPSAADRRVAEIPLI